MAWLGNGPAGNAPRAGVERLTLDRDFHAAMLLSACWVLRDLMGKVCLPADNKGSVRYWSSHKHSGGEARRKVFIKPFMAQKLVCL